MEDETTKRVEQLVAKRVVEELEKRKDEIEAEVLQRVEEAKKLMEEQLLQEMERKRQHQEEEERKKKVSAGSFYFIKLLLFVSCFILNIKCLSVCTCLVRGMYAWLSPCNIFFY